MPKTKLNTGDSSRDTLGPRSIIKAGKHEGPTRRPAEGGNKLDELTAKDIKQEPEKELVWNNPGFLEQGEGKR